MHDFALKQRRLGRNGAKWQFDDIFAEFGWGSIMQEIFLKKDISEEYLLIEITGKYYHCSQAEYVSHV